MGFQKNMLFGYISKRNHPNLENYLEEYDSTGFSFRYNCGAKKAFFFKSGGASPFYHDTDCLLLCEGILVRGSPDTKYELVHEINDEDIEKGFYKFIDEIVSNVSVIFFKKGNNPKLYLSSNRAATNRIYFRQTNEGIFFSSSFSLLIQLLPFKINHEAIYSILKYGYAPPPLTLSKDICIIPPSHYVIVDIAKNEILYYNFFKFCFSEEHGFNLKKLDKTLDAISEMLSGMDSCLLLSGGVDSTLLAHKMRNWSNGNLRSYFLAFGKKDPELPFAEEASKSSNSKLDITYMDKSRLVEIIDEIASFYDHPFKDASVIPTYFLMKHIVDKGEKIVIDGTGADGCFGFETIALEKLWMFMYILPKIVKRQISSIYSYSGIWKREGLLEKLFRTITKCRDIDGSIGNLISSPPNDVFFSNFKYDENINELLLSLVQNLISPYFNKDPFKQRSTVADIIFVCGASAGVKTDLRNKFPQVCTLYPYLWKDILEEQGKILWSAKIKNGIVKWPLKKLLEPYVPHSFIYRKKSGFTPDIESFLKNQKVYNLTKKTFMNSNVINSLVDKRKLNQLVEDLPIIENYSIPLRSLLWGLLFIELWVAKHL
jgi:asparagine synthase (glutamine-hydrolysing)